MLLRIGNLQGGLVIRNRKHGCQLHYIVRNESVNTSGSHVAGQKKKASMHIRHQSIPSQFVILAPHVVDVHLIERLSALTDEERPR
jgi:hypothetical protein